MQGNFGKMFKKEMVSFTDSSSPTDESTLQRNAAVHDFHRHENVIYHK